MTDRPKISSTEDRFDHRVAASEPLRLLMLNSTPVKVFGGVEQWMLRSSLGLMARGHVVHVVGRSGSRFLSRLDEAGIPVHEGCAGMDYSPVQANRIARLARREGLEIAVVNFNKELTHIARARDRSPIRKVIGRSVLPMFDTNSQYRRLYRKNLDGLITPSREVKRVLESFEWLAGTTICNIPNGIDLSRVDRYQGGRGPARQGLGFNADAFIIGTVGRLEPHKGINHLIAAFGLIAEEADQAALVIIGSGSREAELRNHAATLGAAGERVRFLGHMDDPYPLMTTFDTLVLPSTTDYETFGQVLIEAMAFFTPVIGSRVGGVPEVITNGANGYLVPPADRAALAARLRKLATDGALRRKMAREGRRRVEQFYTEKIMLDRLEDFLKQMIRTP